MNISRGETLSREEEGRIYDWINSIIESSDAEKSTRIKEKYDSFILENATERTRKHYVKKKPRQLLYEQLPELCSIAEENFKNLILMLAPVGTVLEYPTEELRTIAQMLDSFPQDKCERIRDYFLKKFISDEIIRIELEDTTLCSRAFNAGASLFGEHDFKGYCEEKGLGTAAAYRTLAGNRNMVKIGEVPRICSELELPLHWIMRLSSDEPVFCKSGCAESCMDYLMLTRRPTRDMLCKALLNDYWG